MDSLVLSAIGLGLVLGLKHATDPDHIVAVSTIVSERRGLLPSAMVGLSWGIGHSTTLLLIAVPVLLFGLTLPEGVTSFAEGGVGVVLVILGLVTLRDLRRQRVHVHVHDHDDAAHLHFHSHGESAGHQHGHLSLRARSVVVGLFQGVAGSTALMVFVLATIDSPLAGLLYVVAYDLAVIIGILVFSLVISLPFTWAPSRVPALNTGLRLVASLASVLLGFVVVWGALVGA